MPKMKFLVREINSIGKGRINSEGHALSFSLSLFIFYFYHRSVIFGGDSDVAPRVIQSIPNRKPAGIMLLPDTTSH